MTDRSPKAGAGTLYVVATPIGNLADITLRALDVLRSVDVIAAEDTRHTRKLLSHYEIAAQLIACHEHNEQECGRELTDMLLAGTSVALLTDAGTPTVSDPGYRVLQAAIGANIRIVPIPGPSAATAALSAAGLPSDAFLFVGFLPHKSAKRQTRLKQLANEPATLIFYESPHRILSLLQEIDAMMGDRSVVLGREMTKRYEEFIRGTAREVSRELTARGEIKGEITLLVSGRPTAAADVSETLTAAIQLALKKGAFGSAQLSRQLAERYGVPKNQIYELILKIKAESHVIDIGKGDDCNG